MFQKSTSMAGGGKKTYGNELGFCQNSVNLSGVATPAVIAQQNIPCFSNSSTEHFDTNRLFSTPDPSSIHMIFSGGCKVERDVVTVSQETGVTSDANPEISSVFSSHEMGKQRRIDSGDGEILPSNPAPEMTLDDCYFWNY